MVGLDTRRSDRDRVAVVSSGLRPNGDQTRAPACPGGPGCTPLEAYSQQVAASAPGSSRFLYTYSLHRVEGDAKPKREAACQASREEAYGCGTGPVAVI